MTARAETTGAPHRRWRVEFSVLLAALFAAGGAWGFVELMEFASAEQPHAFDERILLLFREAGDPGQALGPPWVEEAMRDITALGGVAVLVLLLLFSTLFLLLSGRPGAALFLLIAVGGGQWLSSTLKLFVDRPRPELVTHLAEVFTLSFPSGHAMMSAVTYLTLGSLIARVLPGRGLKLYVLFVAVTLTLLIGVSRVYLGVHWPSDVLAGWCAGAAWAVLCWLLARLLLSRRKASETVVADASDD
ncbi:MAG TPA: phosphatase PAP2 family protein [Mesorhizobium sp.]|jgi:undecaprenyl-diphosphatase|nr:phosphatase PAP2 family protein [Mesorhizobium sp.]